MIKRCTFLALLLCTATSSNAQNPPLTAPTPSLVLTIVVDQMRYDYLTRFGAEFDGGLALLLKQGAVFTNANYDAAPTVTAVGHSTILTGAMPSLSGIAGNTWYERSEGSDVQSITDTGVTPLGGGSGASPHRLAVTTVGDELKISGKGGKVFGVSLKDRGAILPAGRSADAAYWLVNGKFVSSTWYFPVLPAWVENFNAQQHADRYAGVPWLNSTMPATPGSELYRALDASPFADELVRDFALTLMQQEDLGTDQLTDLLSVSFSSVDYVGHALGPDSPQIHDMILRIDTLVGELLAAAERQAGRGKVLVVLTADHGVSPVPEENMAKQLPGGRYDAKAETDAVQAALSAAFGAGNYIEGSGEMSLYLEHNPVPGKTLDFVAIQDLAAATLRQQAHVARVYTRHELESGSISGDLIDTLVRNGFNTLHSGDVLVVHEPGWLSGSSGTTHGSPYSYDTHVPLIFWGPRNVVKPGVYHHEVAIEDIAPTLATLLGIAEPSGSVGRVLQEILP